MKKIFMAFFINSTILLSDPLVLTTKLSSIVDFSPAIVANKSEVRVELHPTALQKNKSIVIDLPDAMSATFVNDKFIYRKEGDFAWSGRGVDGNESDTILLTTKNGSTYGVIVRNEIKYILQKRADGTYRIYKQPQIYKDKNDFIKLPPKKSLQLQPSGINESYVTPMVTEPVATQPADYTTSALSVSSTVDVMILYTQSYADEYGPGLDAKIQFSIDYANVAMENSLVSLAFNLAHQELYENTESNEAAGISNALYHIQGSDAVKRLRAKYGIDMTSLFHLDTDGGTVGLGFLPYNTSRSVMRNASYNVSSFSDEVFAHESGHNFGCGHDWGLDSCSNGAGLFSYSCGFDSSGVGTIMSYNSNNVQYFSNPDIFIDPVYIGVAEGGVNPADCSRTIEETREIMAMNSDVSETNEDGDVLVETDNGYRMTGNINPLGDRDSYVVYLGGVTTIEMSSQYSNLAYFVNLYTEGGYLIDSILPVTSTGTGSVTLTLENGAYIPVISTLNDETGSNYPVTITYTVNLTTEYRGIEKITPIINYLID